MIRLFELDLPVTTTPAAAAPGRTRRWRWAVVVAAALAALTVASLVALRWTSLADERLRAELEAWLSHRLASDVTVDQLSVTLGPRIHVRATGLTLRIRDRPDLPPFVTIGEWTGTARLGGLRIRHFDEVRLSSVTIAVPPRRLRDIRPASTGGDGRRRRKDPPQIRVDRLVADHVVLQVMSRDTAREPHTWDIRDLRMDPFSFDIASPFSATVDTPLPSDRASVTGTAGPWPWSDFDELPLSGDYTMHGQLEDIPGLRGAIEVKGRALGTLDRLATVGTATSQAAGFTTGDAGTLPLDASFEALFDATNSDVHLTRFDARAGEARMTATGHIVRVKGASGRHVSLHVISPPSSSAADVMRLVIDGNRPPVQGALAVDAALELTPGERDVLDRLRVEGSFELRNARFMHDGVQGVLEEMSWRGRGRPEDEASRVRSRLAGNMTLAGRELTLDRVALGVPGAVVAGSGRYSLAADTIDFHGVTKLDAKLSKTQGGFRRWLLKPFDRLLARDGAGTRVVLDVRGTRKDPKVDVDLGASLRGKR